MSKKKKTWRVPPDFRLVDFHKPLLQQAPVIFFIVAAFTIILMILSVSFYETNH